ncbi:hypothetical protein [Nostoc sp. 'Peltigera membranacea cyanobiont' 210A]|uniref:hypothetical protein n=1 Tax=Nostoc sp. 'Peltigera membranacea cyanobiont' 210A TaxID=2014529 RepID=UPI00117DED1D|nr:hypothetical protein [Nostoc sp. 'Peltigera membranacea cyanobiont' 210A]
MLRGSDDQLQELKAMPTATRSRSVSDRRSGNALEHWYDYLPNKHTRVVRPSDRTEITEDGGSETGLYW